MLIYKKILKYMLIINIVFILVVAGLGYQIEKEKHKIKEVTNSLEESSSSKQKKVIPLGKIVGIYVNTNGILVIDTGEVVDMNNNKRIPAKHKLLSGDYILKLNNEKITTKKELISRITKCNGKSLIFTVLRKGKVIDVKVNPVQTNIDEYKVGIWVRDDLQGLGTVTYVSDMHFGALGHSINDTDTGRLLDVSGGKIYKANVFGIEKGKSGTPGEIEGMISYQKENIVGNINGNHLYGIYGTISKELERDIKKEKSIPIANREEIKKGKAFVQSYVSGKKELYEIEIIEIHVNENGDHEMELCITDNKLMELTGGIVQGMSGSPIIQNGKLIGAVTHVFVDNPKRGYGIFIENMLEMEN